MARPIGILSVLLFTLPLSAGAGVIISEIAWMGTDVSPSDEWIELSNEGDLPILLDGWVLKAKDGSPTIPLSGTISGKGYFLIERTNDESVPGIPADLVAPFGKGISNEGETFDLYDGLGTIVDTVRGGKDWKSIGGDAKTRFTPQKRGGVWVTARPTPGASPVFPPPPAPAPPPIAKVAPTPEKNIVLPMTATTPVPVQDESPSSSSAKESMVAQEEELVKVYGLEEASDEEDKGLGGLPILGTLILLGSSAVIYLREKVRTEAERYTIIEKDPDEGR